MVNLGYGPKVKEIPNKEDERWLVVKRSESSKMNHASWRYILDVG